MATETNVNDIIRAYLGAVEVGESLHLQTPGKLTLRVISIHEGIYTEKGVSKETLLLDYNRLSDKVYTRPLSDFTSCKIC